MKITLFLLSILLFSAYTFTFTSGAKVPKAMVNATVSTKAMPKAAGLPEAIRDVAGKIVRPDAYYYILPANSGKGGGLTLDSIGDYGCPLWVVQEPYGYMYGTSVKFYPVNFQKGVIRLSTDMNIEFSGSNYCGESNVWKLGEFDSSMEKYFLGVDGLIGNPSEDTLNNWFTIERSGNAYKLVHCPSVCSDCDPICQDVGIVYHDGKIRLALTDGDALKVVFRKA